MRREPCKHVQTCRDRRAKTAVAAPVAVFLVSNFGAHTPLQLGFFFLIPPLFLAEPVGAAFAGKFSKG